MDETTTPTPETPVFRLDTFFEEAEARRSDRLLQEEPWTQRNPIASDLMACDRYAILSWAAYKYKPPPDIKAKAMMDHGTDLEKVVIRELREEGWDIIHDQIRVDYRPNSGPHKGKTLISGKLDGVIQWRPLGSPKGTEPWMIPFDVKSTSQWNLDRINRWQDLDDSIWTRKWRRQIRSYMLLYEAEHSFLILAHRGDRKWIYVPQDYDEAEAVLRQCELVTEVTPQIMQSMAGHVDASRYNDRLNEHGILFPDRADECEWCPFLNKLCYPNWGQDRTEEVDRPELAPKIARYLELEGGAKEYQRLDRELSEASRGNPVLYAGEYMIEGKAQTQVMKPQPAKPETTREIWRKTVRRIQ